MAKWLVYKNAFIMNWKKRQVLPDKNKHLSKERTNAIISVRKRAPSSGLPSEVKAYFYV